MKDFLKRKNKCFKRRKKDQLEFDKNYEFYKKETDIELRLDLAKTLVVFLENKKSSFKDENIFYDLIENEYKYILDAELEDLEVVFMEYEKVKEESARKRLSDICFDILDILSLLPKNSK